jgi:hypothetical protein
MPHAVGIGNAIAIGRSPQLEIKDQSGRGCSDYHF